MASLGKEIFVTTENKVGMLLKITAPIKEAGVSIRGVCAWGDAGKANFLVVTENNEKANQALKKAGYAPQETEVVLADLANKIGSLAEAAQKLAGAGVDIDHCYVTASGSQALAVFATKDNAKAVKVLG
jgi:hypothetical protein